MGMREKLIELMKKTPLMEIGGRIADAEKCLVSYVFESFADHLIANGVTIPVRCKDCKYYWMPQGFCTHDRHDYQTMSVPQKEDDFCSYGERKEN